MNGAYRYLGPRLEAFETEVNADELECLDAESLRYLTSKHFIEVPGCERARVDRVASSDVNIADVTHFIVANEFSDEAGLLASHLTSPDRPWRIVRSVADLPVQSGTRGVYLSLDVRERFDLGDKPTATPYYDNIWYGDSSDGVHIGPYLSCSQDYAAYLDATLGWSSAQKLFDLGFSAWPRSLIVEIRKRAGDVAQAIDMLLDDRTGLILLNGMLRRVKHWAHAAAFGCSVEHLRDEQLWSKGLIRALTVRKPASHFGAYIASCSSPCGAIGYLEGNSGKGTTRDDAILSALGESVERFSAWHANRNLPAVIEPRSKTLPPYDLHPFGPLWDAWLAGSEHAVVYTPARDEVCGAELLVPRAMVPFPYVPLDGERRWTSNSTAGLAVHPQRDEAVLRGTLELLERDNLYVGFTDLRQATMLTIPDDGSEQARSARSMMNSLARAGIRVWLFTYDDEFQVPIAHAVLVDEVRAFGARGSGSGPTLLGSALRALLEAVQLLAEQSTIDTAGATLPAEQYEGYTAWRNPAVLEAVTKYLDSPQHVPGTATGDENTTRSMLETIKRRLADRGDCLAVVDLPCPVVGWHAVRCLVPGIATNQFHSDSRGGRKLDDAPRFAHALPF